MAAAPRLRRRVVRWEALALLAAALALGPGRKLLPVFAGPSAGRGRPGRRLPRPRAAAPWDVLFGNREPVELPSTMEKLSEELQSALMTSVEKAYPRVDMELPPGLRIGIETPLGRVAPGREAPSAAEVARGDRELAAAWAMLFAGLKNGKAICVAFRNEKLAALAKRKWREMTGVRVIALPNPKQAFGASRSLLDAVQRPYLVAVAPSSQQLVQIAELDEAKGSKVCVVLLNAGLRGREEQDEVREQLAVASNPAFHVRFAGPKGQGLVYHRLGLPWVVARRKPEGELEEVSRSENEPSVQEVESALAR